VSKVEHDSFVRVFDYPRTVRVVRHWWNGSWGRLDRRDVFVRTDGEHWMVEARLGGPDGRSAIRPCVDEIAALRLARHWLGDPAGWTELSCDGV